MNTEALIQQHMFWDQTEFKHSIHVRTQPHTHTHTRTLDQSTQTERHPGTGGSKISILYSRQKRA